MKQNIIKRISERDHYLLRPDTFIGGIEDRTKEFLIEEDSKFVLRTLNYVPGFLKIIEEILDNSIDEASRTNFKFANDIKVKFTKTSVMISDNGRGVPQVAMDDGTLMAVAAFTEPRTGTNYDDETKAEGSIGRNGVGSFATNVFCKKFNVITDDGTNRLEISCENNLDSFDFKQTKLKKAPGTTVEMEPDLERFGLSEIEPIYIELIRQRMIHLAQQFPIKFTLLDETKDLF